MFTKIILEKIRESEERTNREMGEEENCDRQEIKKRFRYLPAGSSQGYVFL